MFYNDSLFVYFHLQKFTINEERGSHANELLDEFLGERWDLFEARPDAEKFFNHVLLGVRFKVKTSLAFEALKIHVQGHRGNYEDYQNYRELIAKNTKSSLAA